MKSRKTAAPSALCTRVAHALALNRRAKLNFPGIFMGIAGRQVSADELMLSVPADPVLQDAHGELNFIALGVLVDVALGAVTRVKAGPTLRPATVHLDMQMTGVPMRGDLATHARYVGASHAGRVRQMFTTATITAGDGLVGHASGAFVMLDLPQGTTQRQLPWLPREIAEAPHAPAALDPEEREAILACRRAEAAATAAHPFIDHFWCGMPKARKGASQLTVKVTPHLGNRVGHVHGGVLLGLAARVAGAAVPHGMRLSNISAWFVSPGLPPRLRVRAKVVQQGRSFSVVHTRIVGTDGKLVLEVTSQHVA
jgi:uncharacterized protein (TIGR00369 family)